MAQKLSRAEQAEKTRRDVFNAAVKLVTEKGFDNVTVRSICESAGVATGTFYLYFKNKVDILKEMHRCSHLYVTDYDYSSECSTALDALTTFYTRYATMVAQDGVDQYWAISNIEREWLVRNPVFYDTLFSIVAWGQKSGELVTDMSGSEITTFLLISIRGVTNDWAFHNGCYSLVSYMGAFMTRILRAFQPGASN